MRRELNMTIYRSLMRAEGERSATVARSRVTSCRRPARASSGAVPAPWGPFIHIGSQPKIAIRPLHGNLPSAVNERQAAWAPESWSSPCFALKNHDSRKRKGERERERMPGVAQRRWRRRRGGQQPLGPNKDPSRARAVGCLSIVTTGGRLSQRRDPRS